MNIEYAKLDLSIGEDMKKKLKLKRWVLVAIHLILVIMLIYAVVCIFTKKTTIITEGKSYTCYGSKILQVCAGNNYDYK